MSSETKASDMHISCDDDIFKILQKVTDGSVGTSEAQLLDMLKALDPGRNTQMILTMCILASMNTKTNVQKTSSTARVRFPAEMKTGDTVNMSVLASIGHIMMTVDDGKFTRFGLERKRKYQQYIGEARDIRDFSSFRVSSSVRTTILKKYRDNISEFKISDFHKVLLPLLPALYTSSRIGRLVGTISTYFNPFRAAGYLLGKMFSILGWLFSWTYGRVAVLIFIFSWMNHNSC